MKRRKCFVVLMVFAILVLASVPVVFATETLMTDYDFAEQSSGHILANDHPSDTSGDSARGQSINATSGGYLTKFEAMLSITNYENVGPEAYLVVKVYNGTGSFGSTMVPTGSALAVSDQLYVTNTTVANQPSYETYNFTFDGTYYLTAGSKYCFSVEVASFTVLSTSRNIIVASDSNGPTATGNTYSYDSSGYTGYGTHDLVYAVYVDTVFGGTDPEDPFDPGTWTDPSDVITAVTSFLVPLTVVLIPVFLLTYLGGKTKWMVLIGLVIGIGLGFYFGFVPLWLVFLITIGIIGMAYQSVRSGGDS